jgi:hypothetical protein
MRDLPTGPEAGGVTRRRYTSYQRALRGLGALDGRNVGSEAIGILRQTAEDLLLSRKASAETEDLADQAAIALTQLTVRGRVSRPRASELWRAIFESGPGGDEAAGSPALESSSMAVP